MYSNNVFSNYNAGNTTPERTIYRAPSWYGPLTIALAGLEFVAAFIPGLNGIVGGLLTAEAFGITNTALGYSVGSYKSMNPFGQIFTNALNLGLPLFGFQRQITELRSAKEGAWESFYEDISNQYEAFVNSGKSYNFDSLDLFFDGGMGRKLFRNKNYLPTVLNMSKRQLLQTEKNLWADKLTLESENKNMAFINGKINLDAGWAKVKALNTATDLGSSIQDSIRKQSFTPEMERFLISLQDLITNKSLEEAFRDQLISELLFRIENAAELGFANDLMKVINTLKQRFIDTNTDLNESAIFVRAWTDLWGQSPAQLTKMYGGVFEKAYWRAELKQKGQSFRQITHTLATNNTIKKIVKGTRMLNPTMVARIPINYAYRKLAVAIRKIFSQEAEAEAKLIKGLDKSAIKAEMKAELKAEGKTLKQLKASKSNITVESSWIDSFRFIEPMIDTSLIMINFKPVESNSKRPVLVWANDWELLQFIDSPGNTYLDNWAISRGGRAVGLTSVLGMSEAIFGSKFNNLMLMPTQAIRNLISVASNLKKTFTGDYFKKWENPEKYLFKSFAQFGISKGSRLLTRNIFGGIMQKYLKLDGTGQIKHFLKHMLPMEAQRIGTTFLAQPLRNVFEGKAHPFSGIGKESITNATKFFRDQSRYLAQQQNPNFLGLKVLKMGRKVNLGSRAASIAFGRKWKRS